MADVLVSIALEKLTNVLEQQRRRRTLSAGTTNELERLKDTVQSTRPLLHDASSREIDLPGVHNWLSKLGNVSYDIDDLLNKWPISGGLGEEGDDDEGNRRYKVCKCLLPIFSRLDRAFSHYKIAISIQEIREGLDDIVREKNLHGFVSSGHGGDQSMYVNSSCLTTSFIEQSEQMIGRDKDKETVISKLVGGNTSPEEGNGEVDVVVIRGNAGVGKRTLAWEIFHDRRVRDHFNMFVWAHVSSISDVTKLTKAILEKVKGTTTFSSDLNSLQNELVEQLRGKCFLLVLDNFHSNPVIDSDGAGKKWTKLLLPLHRSAQGSRILVTTNVQSEVEDMNNTSIHELKGLSNDYSWELFRSRAFVGRKVEEYSKLEDVGREIVEKCAGVPLAIKAIANLMHSKKTVEEWEKILNSNAWDFFAKIPYVWDFENPQYSWAVETLPAVSLIYYNLPSHLKLCFTYCSMLPRGWVFEKDTLVNLWIAQGFVGSEGSRETEDVGAEYFDNLVAGSVFQQVGEDGKTRYAMHKCFNHLATALGQMHKFPKLLAGSRQFKMNLNQRHLFLYFNFRDFEFGLRHFLVYGAKKLRTLWIHGIDISESFVLEILHRAKFLRALILIGSKFSEKIVEVTNAIVKMKHLRYLDLSNSNIVELPEELTHLRNLQTLNLTHCVKLKRLPRRMGEMVSLRYLEIERTDSLEYLPQGLGRISSLQRLCKFIVGGGGSEGEEGCGIEELQQLNSLSGTLRIQHFERVSSSEEAMKAELSKKPHLRRLVISMSGRDDNDEESERMESILTSFMPHPNLEELKLFWYTGSYLPWGTWEMPHLRKVELVGCPRLEELPIYDNVSPTELTLRDCHKLKIWNSSSVLLEKLLVIDCSELFTSRLLSSLVKLKKFEIGRFRNKTFPDEGWNELEVLQTLEIWSCDELKSLPPGLKHLQSLQNLNIFGCKNLEWLPEELGQLKKLKNLEVFSCQKLKALPELPHLQRLSIGGCPLLLERHKRGGVDWPKISHIPNISITKKGFNEGRIREKEFSVPTCMNKFQSFNQSDGLFMGSSCT